MNNYTRFLELKLIRLLPFLLFVGFQMIPNSSNAQETGFFKFEFEADSAYLVFDYKGDEAVRIAPGDSIELLQGSHVIEISHPFKGNRKVFQFIYADSTRAIKIPLQKNGITFQGLHNNFAAYKAFESNAFLMTDSETEIYFRGSYLGTGSVLTSLPTGKHEFTLKHPEFGSKKANFTLGRTLRLKNMQILPSQNVSNIYSVLPGGSQFYKRQYVKGTVFTLGTVLLASQYISKRKTYNDELDYFNDLVERYNVATDEELALQLGNLAEAQQKVVEKTENQYLMLGASTILFYALNIADAWLTKPKGGWMEDIPVQVYLSQHVDIPDEYTTATVRVNF